MPRRRADPTRCANGHDLSDDANRHVDATGKVECRRCSHERVKRHRKRNGYKPKRTRKREPSMSPLEVERFLAQGLAEETAPAWERPANRRMWQPRGSDADQQR